MREINEKLVTQRVVDEYVIATTEELVTINEYKNNKVIYCEIVKKDSEGLIVSSEIVEIKGDDYDLLMSDSPEFAPNKPLNEYRESDIWYVIDLIKSE